MSVSTEPTFTLGNVPLAPGERASIPFPVTRDLDGGEVTIWATVLNGARPGPTLGLFGLQHGDEWLVVDFMRQLAGDMAGADFAGALVLVPVTNPVGFGLGWRNTQTPSDSPDMNRAWPGTYTWLADLCASTIAEQILPHCSAILDFHPGPWGATFGQVRCGADFADADVARSSFDLGLAFGYRRLVRGKVMSVHPGPKSLLGYAGGKLGLPALNVSIGGSGFDVADEQRWIGEMVTGTKNAMRHLEMLAGPLERPERILLFNRVIRVHASVGGLLLPDRTPAEMDAPVTRGERLGRIISPYTFEEVQRLEAPCDGWLAYMPRSYPVHPGDWGFGVIDGSQAEWIEF